VASDIDGQLLGEYTSTGSPIREYIYLEGERVAMYDHTTVEPKDSTNTKAIVYLHNDQVGQVQYAYNSDGQIIYERVQTPFGETMSEMNAYNVQIPVRFPGQYYDSETGFNQNWNRDYDSSLGAYIQPDPRGQSLNFSDPDRKIAALMGVDYSLNAYLSYLNKSYVYADAAPLSSVDLTGEFPVKEVGILVITGICWWYCDTHEREDGNSVCSFAPDKNKPASQGGGSTEAGRKERYHKDTGGKMD
jgi:RHS repeat-associated protein